MLSGHRIVCQPVRSALDASLQGFEVLPLADPAARAAAAPLDEIQLRQVLDPFLARRVRECEAHLWLRLPGSMLTAPEPLGWVRQAVASGGWGRESLTVSIVPGPAFDDGAALARSLRALSPYPTRIALADVGLSDVDQWESHLGSSLVAELRLSAACTAPSRSTDLSAAVRAWRGHRVCLTGLDIGTLEQCDVAIRCGLDLIQGRIAGLMFPLEQLGSALQGMSPPRPAARTWRAEA